MNAPVDNSRQKPEQLHNLNSVRDNIAVALQSSWSIQRSARTEEYFHINKNTTYREQTLLQYIYTPNIVKLILGKQRMS